jgi:hypothetical protein
MGLNFVFGGKSKLHGKSIMMYPARISYVPVSKEGLEEYIFAYEPQPLKIEHSSEEPVSLGDFLTPLTQKVCEEAGLEFGHIYPVAKSELIPLRRELNEDQDSAKTIWSLALHTGDSHVVLMHQKLAFAIPGPETEPHLYEDAEIEINPQGEVTLFYRDLGVKFILETIAADDRFRKDHPDLVAQNELFVINNM